MILEKNGRWGPCKYLGKDEYVGRSIHNYGEYNPDETEKILELANEAGEGTILDIGANIGCISQALVYNGYNVMAFEPQPVLFDILANNIRCASEAGGKLSDIGMMQCAIGSEHGTWVNMPKVHYSEKGNFGGLGIGTPSIHGNIDVLLQSIDSLGVPKVSMMKIDVEGFEIEVLRGAARTIVRDKPILYIEDDRVEKSKALRAFIKELGYSIEEHKPCLYREDNFFGLKRNIWNKLYASHNLVCRPINGIHI